MTNYAKADDPDRVYLLKVVAQNYLQNLVQIRLVTPHIQIGPVSHSVAILNKTQTSKRKNVYPCAQYRDLESQD